MTSAPSAGEAQDRMGQGSGLKASGGSCMVPADRIWPMHP
jgi:hypothetical protein